MWMNKKQKLKASYYNSFFALIVIPILCISLLSIFILRAQMVDSAVLNIRRAQDNIASVLGNEVKDVSLRLSHFIYVNDSEIVRNAARTNSHDPAEKYHYTQILTESFNYAMVPVQDILSAVFYMKSGDHTYMKSDIILNPDQLKTSQWYQEALLEPNVVKVGFYDYSVMNSRKNAYTLTIAAGLSPGPEVDREGVIEMAALFVSSQAGRLMKEYNKESMLGSAMIADKSGHVIFDAEDTKDLLPETITGDEREFSYRINGKRYMRVATVEPVTGLSIISVVSYDTLTSSFNRTAMILIGVVLFLFLLFYLFSSYFLKSIIEPIHNTVEGMRMVEEGNLEVHVQPKGQAELRLMIHSFNSMTRRFKTLMAENEEQQQKKHKAEIRALQSQINPHFLVNSLNSIRFIAQMSKYESIARMAEALIKILSGSFRSNNGFYTLKEELEVLDSFIYLMKIRYSDGFDIVYQVDDACLLALVPRLILQPVVENSIVHGFDAMMEEMGTIWIVGEKKEGFLFLEIRDNGKGMTREEISSLLSDNAKESERRNVGIHNVRTRLSLNYGEQCSFVMESEPGEYTRTLIRIPVSGKENET
ncbi:histidine kinase [Clostridium boliviensis]|uniref:Histidine kinase n=1 Tax=Clostridium boliviensis TaxID=318465 RepID=A0ABU4GL64_9CLOT|nr:histidine kinase [Clostridium boliviensis]MDW2798353.1 histidine kinase [Clostridium boliviensis]